jgi:hypothetical protein
VASPFADYANALLTFQVSSGTLAPDSKGNMRPGKATIQVTALLQQKRDPNREPRPGVDESSIWVEGYITQVGADPEGSLVLPSVVTPDSPCAATWQGRAGRFQMEFTARNPYLAALEVDAVEKIRGYFVPGSFVVSGEPWSPTPTPTPTTGGAQYSGELTASASLSALRVVVLEEGNELIYADSGTPGHAFKVVGLLPSAVAAGSTVQVLTDGAISDSNWNWDTERPIFLGLNGQLTQTAPTTGFLLQVATATTPTQIDFEIQEAILL